jgi:hypothetical protein
MAEVMAPARGDVVKVAILATAVVGGLVAGRYFSAKKINGAERLADALLDTDSLKEGLHTLSEATEKTLSACAAYLVGVASRASEGVGSSGGAEDPIGYSRTHTHPYTHTTATVLTESVSPEQLLTYAVNVPDVGEVRGTRRVGALKMSGLSPARPANDTVQITLPNGYTAQLESEFEVGDYLVTGRSRLFGAATLRDSEGNVGRINIAHDGAITGTVTREAKIIGRFEGQVTHGLRFRQNQIEGG